jgi:SAM-dependent methyltransferase
VSDVFSSLYAATYDALYREKDYGRECEMVLDLLREYGRPETRSILDLGCGTGRHALPFAEMGLDVVGVERSPAMLDRARTRVEPWTNIELVQSDIRNLELDRQFDGVVMLFAVLGYQTSDDDVVAALETARRHLVPGGALVFDVWYGPAVLHQGPSSGFSRIPLERGELLREVKPELDEEAHLCRVRYELSRIEDEQIVERAAEEHAVRFFFPDELRSLLERAGFSLVRLSAFPEVDRIPDETTWNVIAVARAS